MSIRHVAMSFAYSFRSRFNNEIGLKFAGVFWSFPGLGRATIRALSISGGKEKEAVAALNKRSKYSVDKSLYVW